MSIASDNCTPANRVTDLREDVWSIINNAVADSPIQPVVNMGQGFFDCNPPDFAINAAKNALDRVDCNQYAPTRGRDRLRQAIATDYSASFNRSLSLAEVTVTTGANEGILCAFMGFISPGDEVILFEPFFDQYISNIEMAGGVIRYVPLEAPLGSTARLSSSEWSIDFRKLRSSFSDKTKMIVLNSPHNPIGKIFSPYELEVIAELCIKYDVIILSDEVYDRLCYSQFTRIATLSDEIYSRTLTVGSAGKAFQATGWRVGYLIGPEHLIRFVAAAHTRICYSSVSPLQEAVAEAFEQAEQAGFWDRSLSDMKRKLGLFTEVFDELNVPYTYPEGGYFVLVNMAAIRLPQDYIFPRNISTRARDFHLAYFLIKEIGVASIPASEFYTEGAAPTSADYLRFSICKRDQVLEEAKARLRKLKRFLP